MFDEQLDTQSYNQGDANLDIQIDPEEQLSFHGPYNNIIGEHNFVVELDGPIDYYQEVLECLQMEITNSSHVDLHLKNWGSKLRRGLLEGLNWTTIMMKPSCIIAIKGPSLPIFQVFIRVALYPFFSCHCLERSA